MNSIIASNINGTISNNKLSINQQVANGTHTSLLSSSIEFAVSGNKEHSSAPFYPGKYLVNLNSPDAVFNGQKKPKNHIDQEKPTINNLYHTVNGTNENKEKTIDEGIPVPKVQLYCGKIHVEWKQTHKIGAGLNNLGNSCFMNTVLQCLTYCPPLTNYLLHDNDHASKCCIQGFCMTCLLQKHIKRSIGKTGEVVKPMDIYQRLKLIAKHFQFGRQEDAHEYLRYVIDNLWKSCLAQTNNSGKLDPASKETTVINQIFGGYHRSQVTCLRCKEKSNTFDHFMDFILDIKQNVVSLEKALDKFIQPELLEEENSYKCPKCKMKVTAQKKFTVYKTPNVATFQFKRFDYNRIFGGKITKQVSYPERLNLRPFMSESKGDPVWYRLNAVLVHAGASCNSGHYYCYVKNSNGLWYIMDDQRVHQVSLTQVLNQCAYVLFYIKAETGETQASKKSLENRNLQMKGNSSASNFKKKPEISLLKSSPLTERNQAKQSSSMVKHQAGSSVNLNGKTSILLTSKRDKISFGIRTSMPNINDLCNPSSPKKNKESVHKASSNHSALVPYSKDSSESSDENENRTASSTTDPALNDTVKHKNKTGLPNGIPKLDIRRKVSKSSSNVSRYSANSQDSNSSSSKVAATSSWTVTDVPVSPSAGSSCSTTSVNSTTDWHVTKAKSVSPPKGPQSGVDSQTSRLPPLKDKLSPEPDVRQQSTSKSQDSTPGPPVLPDELCGKNSDFRKQSQCEKPFLGPEKDADRTHHNTFLKRKICDSGEKVSENGESRHYKKQFDSLSKKSKSTEEPSSSFSSRVKDSKTDSHNCVNNKPIYKDTSSSQTMAQSIKHSSTHNSTTSSCDSKSQKSFTVKKRSSWHSSASSSDSEYEWVEKTKDNSESFVSPRKAQKKNHYHFSSSSSYHNDRKSDVISELTSNSKHFYGSSVPTWNGDSRYIESSRTNDEKRKYVEDYEDEYDRGKIRKMKDKDRFYNYHGNPFQKYSEHNYHDKKFHKHNNYEHYQKYKPYNNYKPYDNWKRSHHNDYHRNQKHFRPHYRR